MKVNELFCRECVEQIYVPDVVRVDLLSIIEEKLKKAGILLQNCLQGESGRFYS